MKALIALFLLGNVPCFCQAPLPQGSLEEVSDFSAKPTKLDGLWVKDLSPTVRATKFYAGGRVFITHIDVSQQTVIHHMAGIFSFDGKVLKERINCATTEWKQYVGPVVLNRIGFEGADVYVQVNTAGHREVWRKLQNP